MRVERVPAAVDEVVLVPVVYGAHEGAVAELLADFGDVGVEVGLGDLAEAFMAKLARHGLHLHRHDGVVCGEGRVVAANVDEHEGVASGIEVEGELGARGLGTVLEAHERKAAEADRELVHEAAGLAEVDVLRTLPHLGEFDGRDGLGARLVPEQLHDAAVERLDRGRGREPATGRDVGRAREVEARRLAARGDDGGRHAAHDSRRGDVLLLARVETVTLLKRVRPAQR